MASKRTSLIMVLNDGETFSALEGCRIYSVPDDMDTEDIEHALSEDELKEMARFKATTNGFRFNYSPESTPCWNCGATNWRRGEDGKYCGSCGLMPLSPEEELERDLSSIPETEGEEE